jgi:hypothetical protein
MNIAKSIKLYGFEEPPIAFSDDPVKVFFNFLWEFNLAVLTVF